MPFNYFGRGRSRLPVLGALLLFGSMAQAQLHGAIFTSTSDGTTVNANLFDNKEDVYLNGGPQNQNAAGLPDGVYFFQVTNPNGHVLLSTTNAMDREVKITNGRFAGRCDDAGNLLPDPVSPHQNGIANNASGGVPVQLFPYLDTPNNGGEYKAWLILRRFDGDNTIYATPADDNLHLNFVNRYAKTDNFKVRVQPPVTQFQGFLAGLKFFDVNMNGQLDPQESPIQGFVIKIILNGDTNNPVYVTTDAAGVWKYGPIDNGTTYKISEVLPPSAPYGPSASTKWVQTSPGTANDATDDRGYEGTMNVQQDGDTMDGNDFGNTQVVTLSGVKFYDKNLNGQQDPGEPAIPGWKIDTDVVYPDTSEDKVTLTTDSNGAYSIANVPIGSSYSISEQQKNGWAQTGPAGNLYSGNIILGAGPYTAAYDQPDVKNLDFGNILQAKIKGIKFKDSNMNGQADPNEAKLQGFTIHISGTKPDGTPYTDSAVTDGQGAYSFGPYPDGTTYSITEDVPGGWLQTTPSPVTGTLTASGTDATSTLGDVTVNIGNIKTYSISGVKFYDKNMNGLKDGTEGTLQGFTINLTGTKPDGTSINDSTTTDSNGAYSFGPYPDGTTYSITETVPAGWKQTTTSPITGTLNGLNATNLNIGNILMAKLKGVKFYDANMNGTQDGSEATVPGFTIKITGTKPDGSAINDSTVTDSNGAYEFGPYPDGTTYSITEILPAGWKQTTASPITGTLAASGSINASTTLPDVTGLNIGNILLGKIKGVKFLDANTNGQKDSGEVTLQGFTIKITGTKPDGTPISESKVTDINGAYEFGPYPDGTTYSITETVPAGWVQTTPSPVTGTISATAPITGSSSITDVTVNVGNIKVFKISGVKFYDKNDNGAKNTGEAVLAGFTIKITGTKPDGSSINDSTTTDSNGAYSFGPYPDGTTYSITENVPTGWMQTTTSPLTGTLNGADATNVNVGNILVASIKGVKFYDANMNGAKNSGEGLLAGFTIKISFTLPNGQTGSATTTTDSNGAYSFGPYPDGTSYSITETVPSGWLQTTASPVTGTLSAGSTITINTVLADVTVNVGNILTGSLQGDKFYDTNANGAFDNEPFIKGFKIQITWKKPNGTTGTDTVYTNVSGVFTAGPYPDGTTFTIKEVLPPNPSGKTWQQSFPSSGTYTGTITASGPITVGSSIPTQTGFRFGNFLRGGSGALTLGYWSNKNGYDSANSMGWTTVFGLLNNSNLRNANGTFASWPVSSAGYKTYQSWLLSGNATNMAYMLSVQLSALMLDVQYGKIGAGTFIYAPGTLSANSLGFASVGSIIAEAKAELGLHGNTVSGGPQNAFRAYQDALQNAIMQATNGSSTTGTVQPPVTVIVPSPY